MAENNKPKPAASTKPATTTKPAASVKPVTTAKPAATAKPATTAKPAASVKPATTAKPAASVKPATAAKPAASVKPATAAKPAASVKPVTTAKPAATAKPATTAKPAANVKPATTAKPAANVKPATTAKPAASVKPATTAKPAASVKPVTTAKPAATAKPATTAKPAASVKPATAAKPAATAKPATAAKPAATAKPATSAKSDNGTTKSPEPVTETAAAAAIRQEKVKPEKDKKEKKQRPAKTDGGSGKARAAAITKDRKPWIIAIAVISLVLVAALIIGIVLGAKSCNSNPNGGFDGTIEAPEDSDSANTGGDLGKDDPYDDVETGDEHYFEDETDVTAPVKDKFNYNTALTTASTVGYAGKQIGTVDRNVPTHTRSEGLGTYPKYGTSLSTVIGTSEDKVAARKALISESNYLTATGTSGAGGGGYTWMDHDGSLHGGTRANPTATLDSNGHQRYLYKHAASVNLYFGNVADDEPGIIKKVTMRPRTYTRGYGVTGVYAPAGEVIKIQISDADMNATGGITIHIGQALFNGKANNIWVEKNQMPRIAHLLNTMQVNKDTAVYNEETGVWTAYVGSFIGGPLYIRNETVTFTATISGGVSYPHFILGYTTEKEFNDAMQNNSAPYFDLEVWDSGVLHSGPKTYAQNFSYEDIYNAAVLWDKVATVANENFTDQGIVFLYDPFVAAGAAVAFPGQGSVNCPLSWMKSSLDYNAMVTSGSWGNFHEYHHNYQNFGVGYTGEVTNNSLNLVAYSLFTKVSAARGLSGYGAAGLSGWNTYTSATWALQRVKDGAIESTNGLAVYATLLHNLGQDAFTKTRGTSGAAYFNKWAEVTHQDFSYYANLVSAYAGNLSLQATDYPAFIPVSSVYQTGRSYNYDGEKKYITTMQPFLIPYGEEYTVDLRPYTANGGQYSYGSVILPNGFKYSIKSITQPANGTLTQKDANEDKVFTYTPASGTNMKSGKIYVTLEITTADGQKIYNGHKLEELDLVLEFEQTRESTKSILERTTYTYSADNMYTDAEEAYNVNFAGYESTTGIINHFNPTQNCNTDIWFRPNTDKYHQDYPNDPEEYFVHNNTIEVLDGKIYFEEAGKYRIYLRGRLNCAVYYSLDGGVSYKLGATIKDKTSIKNSHLFRPADSNTYFDLEFAQGEQWVYLKEVLIVQSSPAVSYIGLGMSQWTEPMYTTVTKYYDKNGNEVAENSGDAVSSKTLYYDANGKEVTAEQANDTALIEPSATVTPTYINAYRRSYEFSDNSAFESEYFYKKNYKYTYNETEEIAYDENSKLLSYTKGDNIPCTKADWWYPPENILNDLSGRENRFQASHKILPITLTVDIGRSVTANRCEITGYKEGGGLYYPQRFKILVYNTLEEMEADPNGTNEAHVFIDCTGADVPTVSGTADIKFTIPEFKTFRYYKFIITKMNGDNYPQVHNVKFLNVLNITTQQYAPDNAMFTYTGTWGGVQTDSSFGHAYLGAANSTMTFEFTGKRVGFFSSLAYGREFEIYVDDVKIEAMKLKNAVDNRYLFLSEELENGKHTVQFKCTGEANIDSVLIG